MRKVIFLLIAILLLPTVSLADFAPKIWKQKTLHGVKAITPTSNNTGALYVKEVTTTKMNADEVEVGEITTSGGITADNMTVDNMTISDNLTVGSITADNMTISDNLTVRSITADNMTLDNMTVQKTLNATGGIETPSVETLLPSDKKYPDSLSLRNMSDVPAIAYAPANLTKDAAYYPTPYIKSISCTNNSVDCEIPYAETFNTIYHSDGQLSSITATFNPECIGQNFIAHANGLHTINITPTNGTSINGVLGTCVQVPPTSVVRLYCTAVGHAFAYPISGTVNYVKLGDMILP